MSTWQQAIRFATATDGVRIAYAVSGRGDALVRAPHWMTHLEWEAQTPVFGPWLRVLSERHRLLRYDSRGSGLSDRDPPSISFGDQLSDLEAVVEAAGLEHFSLLGMSWGGAVAIRYAARHPERVSRLVLFDAFARGPLARGATAVPRPAFEAMCTLVETGWGQDNPAFRQMFTTQFWPRATLEHWQAFNELQRRSCTPAAAVRLIRAAADIDVTADLAQIRCPTLVLHCRGDLRAPFDEGRLIAASIPDARFEPLASDNHMPLEGEPAYDAAQALIRDFIGRTASTGTIDGLSLHEREVVELLARGLDNSQIAAHLDVAEKTVRNRVSAVFAKLGVENRAQAIVQARNAGFGLDAGRPSRR
jgi:pimeloyl-ACP methyl ester carboxylesterase/DNA-binding CsgD family transcriptional regulator